MSFKRFASVLTCFTAVSAALLFLTSPSHAQAATSYVVSPNGSGSSCTSQSPCSLDTGLDKAGAGDEVVLMDGTYKSKINTARGGSAGQPIVIRAENRHKATVMPPDNWVAGSRTSCSTGGTGSGPYVNISKPYITVRGIVFDGNKRSWGNFKISHGADHVTIEDNNFINSQYNAVAVGRANGFTFRFNEVNDTPTEGISIGGHSTTYPVNNVQVYGNIFRNSGSNALEFKAGVSNSEAHHNIIEGSYKGGLCAKDGITVGGSENNRWYSNIIRNSKDHYTAAFDYVKLNSNTSIDHNVMYNILGRGNTHWGTVIWWRDTGLKLNPAKFTDNTMCNTPERICPRHPEKNGCAPTSGIINAGNRFNAPQSQCDAEVDRIMDEMKTLPGAGSGGGGSAPRQPYSCHILDRSQAIPSPYGAAYNLFSVQKEPLLSATCHPDRTEVTVGNGNETGDANNRPVQK